MKKNGNNFATNAKERINALFKKKGEGAKKFNGKN